MAREPFLINPRSQKNPLMTVVNPKKKKEGRSSKMKFNLRTVQKLTVPAMWGAGGAIAVSSIPALVKIENPNMKLAAKLGIGVLGGILVANLTKQKNSSLAFSIGALSPVLAGLITRYLPIPGVGAEPVSVSGIPNPDGGLPQLLPSPVSNEGVGDIGVGDIGAFVEEEDYL